MSISLVEMRAFHRRMRVESGGSTQFHCIVTFRISVTWATAVFQQSVVQCLFWRGFGYRSVFNRYGHASLFKKDYCSVLAPSHLTEKLFTTFFHIGCSKRANVLGLSFIAV